MSHKAYYSETLDQPAPVVWDVVRDFNSYPIWVKGVEDSHIEDDLSGTAVGAVRNFAIDGARTRQRLVAHSDADRFLTYESCDPLEIDVVGTARTLRRYQGTLRLRPITEGDRCLVEWSSEYECPHEHTEYWADWWAAMLPTWVGSLRDHIGGQPEDATSITRVRSPGAAVGGGDPLARRRLAPAP